MDFKYNNVTIKYTVFCFFSLSGEIAGTSDIINLCLYGIFHTNRTGRSVVFKQLKEDCPEPV